MNLVNIQRCKRWMCRNGLSQHLQGWGSVRELEVLPGSIIGGHSVNIVRCADDTVLRADKEMKLQECLQK